MDISTVPVFRPLLPSYEDLGKYLKGLDENRTYTNFGPLVMEFENRIADHLGIPVENVATAANGTLALEGALETLPGSRHLEVELPSWTFTATASAVLRTRGVGRFLDVDSKGRVLKSKSRGTLIETLPWGAGLRDPNSASAPETEGRPCIVDAAASFDALKGKARDVPNDAIAMVSLHATKCLPAGEGAFVFSWNAEWISDFRQWTNFGMWGNRISTASGTNAKLSEYAAAVGLASLDEWASAREEWMGEASSARRLSASYGLRISDAMAEGLASPYWLVEVDSVEEMETLMSSLSRHGVSFRRWWEAGCHNMPAYVAFSRDPLPQTERLASTTVGLPLFRRMSTSQWGQIEVALDDFSQAR